MVGGPYFGITFRVTATSSVRLVTTDGGYDDLTLFVDTLAGTTLAPGEVRLLDGQAAVCTCQLAHPSRGTPPGMCPLTRVTRSAARPAPSRTPSPPPGYGPAGPVWTGCG